MKRLRLDVFYVTAAFFALMGAGLSCRLIALQAGNPSGQILSLSHYQSYALFYAMGARLDEFGRLGEVAAVFTMLCFMLWAARQMRLIGDGQPRDYTLGQLLGRGLQAVLLYLVTAGVCVALWWMDVVAGSAVDGRAPAWLQLTLYGFAMLYCGGLARALWLQRRALQSELTRLRETWRGGPLCGDVVVCMALFACCVTCCPSYLSWLPQQFSLGGSVAIWPPFLWTHFGPLGIALCVTSCAALLGVAVAIAMYGLLGDESLDEVRLPVTMLVSLIICLCVLSLYGGWLRPRYQIGQDLRRMLHFSTGHVAGHTTAWLDGPRPALVASDTSSMLTDDNVAALERWLRDSPYPSALTRPAATVVGNRAIYDWDVERALAALRCQQVRQPNDSNLNFVMYYVLRQTMPMAAHQQYVGALSDPTQFAWPDARSRQRVAELLSLYGQEDAALQWRQDGLAEPPVELAGRVRGRLVLDGVAAAGARVAVIRATPAVPNADGLVAMTHHMLDDEMALIGDARDWSNTLHRYPRFATLAQLYAVVSTDANGEFDLHPLAAGSYLLLARLPGVDRDIEVKNGVGLVVVDAAHLQTDLHTVELVSR